VSPISSRSPRQSTSPKKSPRTRGPPTIDIELLDDESLVAEQKKGQQSRWRTLQNNVLEKAEAYPSSETVEQPDQKSDHAFDDDSSVGQQSVLKNMSEELDDETFSAMVAVANFATPNKGQQKLVEQFF